MAVPTLLRGNKPSSITQHASAPTTRSTAWWMSVAAGAAALVAAAPTFLLDLLTGPAVMNGSARGTALVVLLIALPSLAGSLYACNRGVLRARFVWLGALAYLFYNAVLFLFATPFNRLFPLYIVMASTALWAVIAVVTETDADALTASVAPGLPRRAIAVYVWVMVAFNALAWAAIIAPALSADRPGSFLDGTGMTTNPIHVQDFVFWLPLAAAGAAALWRRNPRGSLVVGSILAMWVIEALSIATDQWFGHQADPASTIVSTSLILPFVISAGIGFVPLWFFLRPGQTAST